VLLAWLRKKHRSHTDGGMRRHDAVNGGGELSGSRRAPSLRAGPRPTFRTRDLESVLPNDIIQKKCEAPAGESWGRRLGKTCMHAVWRLSTLARSPSILPNYENPSHPHRPRIELPIGGILFHRHCLHQTLAAYHHCTWPEECRLVGIVNVRQRPPLAS
jgi:hypothetical protein